MIREEKGFTMVELLITMVVFVFVMTAASQIFSGLLTQFKQQSKIAETSIEGIIGLEILRQDLEHAGYGLPWNIERVIMPNNDPDSDNNLWEHLSPYIEASSGASPNPASFNDSTNDLDGDGNDGETPRAIVSGNNINSAFNNSDYLVIKSNKVGLNEASQKWTILKTMTALDNPRQWAPESENLESSDRVIVIAPGSRDEDARRLILDTSNNYRTTFENVSSSTWAPPDNFEAYLVYGINGNTDLVPVRPFNRADYFIAAVDQDGKNIIPQRCAQNTGVLVKAIMNHDNTGSFNYLPLLDCVADIQVIYRLDMDEDGTTGTESNADGTTISGVEATIADVQATLINAADLRRRLREVRVFILAHEGQRDVNYAYGFNSVIVGDPSLGSTFDLTKFSDWQNYRWKVFSITVNPVNLLR